MSCARAANPVLYVEDEENDAFLLGWAFQRAGVSAPVKVLKDGREAVKYLAGEGPYVNRDEHPLPRLVLLDLNLPVMDGFKLLQWIRQQPAFELLPVVIFSSSNQANDMERARALGANDYFVKPVNMSRIEGVVRTLHETWLQAPSTGG